MFRKLQLLTALAILAGQGCATVPAGAPGSQVYRVRVATVDGQPTATRGAVSNPACIVQFGNQVARVWIAHPSNDNAVSPVILQADEATLKAGVLVERSFNEAVVHEVTDAELASGVAVIMIPSIYHFTTVELAFEPVGGRPHLEDQDDLSKGGAGLDEAMPRRNVSKR